MINTSNPELAQLAASKQNANPALRLILMIGLGSLGILLYLALLAIEASPLISFAVMFFIFVPVSRAIYNKYTPSSTEQG
ncbi:hypothetical protein [Motiliproteus sp.]|uniref:hypothetical protein n=1 Tax=Motiliproteus sp. TaxID=1898955 RepID=UPI003BA9DA90